jgi:hypothetical protein
MTAKMHVHWCRQQPMTMLAQLQQRRHCNEGNNPHCNNSKDACASTTTMPSQGGQQHHSNDSKDACASMMMMTPLQQGQLCQLEDGDDTIATKATMPLQIKGNNAIVMRATTPSQWWQRCLHIDNCNDAIVMRVTIAIATTAKTLCINGNNAIMMWVTTSAQWQATRATTLNQQQRRQASASTTVMTPLWQEQQLPLQQQQRRLHIDGNDASLPSSNEGSNIDDDNGAIAMKVTMPAWGWQQCHHNKGNDAIADQGQRRHCYKGNEASLTTARMPAHQQRQQCHCHEGDNCNGNNGKDACALTATTPSQQGQQCQLNDKQRGQQRQLDNEQWGWQH